MADSEAKHKELLCPVPSVPIFLCPPPEHSPYSAVRRPGLLTVSVWTCGGLGDLGWGGVGVAWNGAQEFPLLEALFGKR